MRISDWSSDVCSSDLEKALGRKVDFTVANDYRTVSEALDQGFSLDAVRSRSKAFKSITRISDALAASGPRAEERLEPRIASVPGRPVQEIRRCRSFRSEDGRVGIECVSTGRVRWAQYI